MEGKQKINGKSISVLRTRDSLTVLNQKKERKTVKYTLEASHNNPLNLKHYMNLMNISLKEAILKLENCGALFLNENFQIVFSDEENLKEFLSISN